MNKMETIRIENTIDLLLMEEYTDLQDKGGKMKRRRMH